jgi:hypothetical protein
MHESNVGIGGGSMAHGGAQRHAAYRKGSENAGNRLAGVAAKPAENHMTLAA